MEFGSSFLLSASLLLLAEAARNIMETLDNLDKKESIYTWNNLLMTRKFSQAMLWEVRSGQSFSFYLQQKEDCQEVWVCTDTKIDTLSSATLLTNPKTACQKYVRFRPMESSVAVVDATQSTTDEATRYPYSKSIVNFDFDGKTYKLSTQGERDVLGNPTGSGKVLEISIEGLPLIVTSSPYCQPIVFSYQEIAKSLPISSVALAPKDFEIAFYQLRKKDAKLEKKFGGLLVPTRVDQFVPSQTVDCPAVYQYYQDSAEAAWNADDEMKKVAVHTMYTIRKKDGFRQKYPRNIKSSFMLAIDNPRTCNWVRVCFLEDSGSGKLCQDPKKSVELLLSYKLFVGVDSDEAQSLEGSFHGLRNTRFEMRRKTSTNEHRLIMSYNFVQENEGSVQHRMFGQQLADWMNDTQKEFQVSLARDGNCMARLVSDDVFESADAKQELALKKCDVLVPKAYTKFPGSDSIDFKLYGPVS